MPAFKFDDSAPILVEFTPRAGLKETSLKPEDLTAKSAQALDAAMNTIYNMARRVTDTVDALVSRPNQVEVAFGLKFDSQAGVLLAKAGLEASLNIKLIWQQEQKAAIQALPR